jgi:hypothetical protein
VWTPTPLRRAMSACAEPAAPSLLSAASDSPHSPPVQSVAAAESPPIHRVRRTHAWQVAVRTPGGWVDMLLYPLCALALLLLILLPLLLPRAHERGTVGAGLKARSGRGPLSGTERKSPYWTFRLLSSTHQS